MEDEKLEFNEEIFPVEGDHINCVTHRVCITPKTDKEIHRHNLFRTRGTVKGKINDIIIDNGSTNNLISSQIVSTLKLAMEKHPQPIPAGLDQEWGGSQCY